MCGVRHLRSHSWHVSCHDDGERCSAWERGKNEDLELRYLWVRDTFYARLPGTCIGTFPLPNISSASLLLLVWQQHHFIAANIRWIHRKLARVACNVLGLFPEQDSSERWWNHGTRMQVGLVSIRDPEPNWAAYLDRENDKFLLLLSKVMVSGRTGFDLMCTRAMSFCTDLQCVRMKTMPSSSNQSSAWSIIPRETEIVSLRKDQWSSSLVSRWYWNSPRVVYRHFWREMVNVYRALLKGQFFDDVYLMS